MGISLDLCFNVPIKINKWMNATGVTIFRIFSENLILFLAFNTIFLKFLTHVKLWESAVNILVFTVNLPLLDMDSNNTEIENSGRVNEPEAAETLPGSTEEKKSQGKIIFFS